MKRPKPNTELLANLVCASLRVFIEREKREEIEKADQAFFNQEGNVTDKFNEVDANIHRIVENPLPESTGADVREGPLPEEIRWTREKTPHPKSEQSDS